MNLRGLLFAAVLLTLGPVAADAACPGGPTTTFTVTGQVKNPTIFDIHRLQQLPTAQQNITYFAAGAVTSQSFTGALLWDLLNNSAVGGIVVDPSIKNDILHKIVIVTGSDCYQSVFGAAKSTRFSAAARSWSPMPPTASRSERTGLPGSPYRATRPADGSCR